MTSAEAETRLAAEGPNALPARGTHGVLAIAVSVVTEPIFLLLLGAALLYVVMGDWHEAAVLGASLLLMGAITIVQERRAERALEALRDLSSPRALVIRDGERRRIAGRDVVRGDLLLLAEGDRVPADARLLQAQELAIDESLLTGESLAVEKGGGEAVFSGTLVVRGHGRAEVTATGARSELGRIGASLATLDPGQTSLQRETGRIVRYAAGFAIVTSALLALFYALARGDWIAGTLAGLTLAMSILPEEFPVVLTLFLALGAWRISRHGVLTRRMPAIEMLGAATVLCVDKTGTLTENRMQVVDTPPHAAGTAALASELEAFDPMEKAIVAAASAEFIETRKTWKLEKDYPFTDDFLAVCHFWRAPDGSTRVAVKGAPETVLGLCGSQDKLSLVKKESEKGRRVLAAAECEWQGAPLEDPRRYPWRFAGLVLLADPLRASVPEAVAQCRRAGIRVVMITGDHPGTALEIGRSAGLDASSVLTGDQLSAFTDEELREKVKTVNVFARVRPEQKLRLVQAYRAAGEVVAMTGDGVNDAPALKAAHIGVAMGERGTDVAREAAALVLVGDDFGSIVRTVRLGRRIYENISGAMRYLVSVHVPIAGMSFLPLALGTPLFLFPVHVVFLEFVIDPACTLVFEAEPSEEGAMARPPRDPAAPLFGARMLWTSLGLGATMLAAILVLYWALTAAGHPDDETRAAAFAGIVFGNLALILVTRARSRGLWRTLLARNVAFWWVAGGALAALFAALYAPPVAEIFRFAPLSPAALGAAFLAGVGGVIWVLALRPAGSARASGAPAP